jgi:hypothetical protein
LHVKRNDSDERYIHQFFEATSTAELTIASATDDVCDLTSWALAATIVVVDDDDNDSNNSDMSDDEASTGFLPKPGFLSTVWGKVLIVGSEYTKRIIVCRLQILKTYIYQ